jgi:hypothetical protein
VATKVRSGHAWEPKEALDALAEIGLLLREVGAEVAWHCPSRWRGTVPELALTVSPWSAGGPSLSTEDVADALQVLGWHRCRRERVTRLMRGEASALQPRQSGCDRPHGNEVRRHLILGCSRHP